MKKREKVFINIRIMTYLLGIGRRITLVGGGNTYLQVDKCLKGNLGTTKLERENFFIRINVYMKGTFKIMKKMGGGK